MVARALGFERALRESEGSGVSQKQVEQFAKYRERRIMVALSRFYRNPPLAFFPGPGDSESGRDSQNDFCQEQTDNRRMSFDLAAKIHFGIYGKSDDPKEQENANNPEWIKGYEVGKNSLGEDDGLAPIMREWKRRGEPVAPFAKFEDWKRGYHAGRTRAIINRTQHRGFQSSPAKRVR